jgi:hypothetical protein
MRRARVVSLFVFPNGNINRAKPRNRRWQHTTEHSREELRTRQLDAAHDIRRERFAGRCRRVADLADCGHEWRRCDGKGAFAVGARSARSRSSRDRIALPLGRPTAHAQEGRHLIERRALGARRQFQREPDPVRQFLPSRRREATYDPISRTKGALVHARQLADLMHHASSVISLAAIEARATNIGLMPTTIERRR